MILPNNVAIVIRGSYLYQPIPELCSADVLLGLLAAYVALEHHIAVVRRPDYLPTVLGGLVGGISDPGQPFRCLGDVLTEPSGVRALTAIGSIELVADRSEHVDEDECRRRRHVGSLAALLYEAIAAVGVLRDHNERAVLEACLSLERLADEVVVLVLRRNALAALALDLRVKSARAYAQCHTLAGPWEKLPSVLGDQDAGLSNVLAAKPVTIGRSGNTHVCTYFRMKRGRLLVLKQACPLDARARARAPRRHRDRPENGRGARRAQSSRPRANRPRSGACSPGSR